MKKLLSVFMTFIALFSSLSCDCFAKTNFLSEQFYTDSAPDYKKNGGEQLVVREKNNHIVINNECHAEESLKSKFTSFGGRWFLTACSASLISDTMERWLGNPLAIFSKLLSPVGFLYSTLKGFLSDGVFSKITNWLKQNDEVSEKQTEAEETTDAGDGVDERKIKNSVKEFINNRLRDLKWGLYFSAIDSYIGFPICLCLPLVWKANSLASS